MKRLFFSLFVSLLCITNAFAQQQMAVLSHNGEIKAFYGSEAYIQAMDEADNGDVITLSSGMFDATDISKSVMIRGAGMENDTITGREATYIVGDYAVGIDNEVKELTIEGICFSGAMHVFDKGCLDYVTFNKCKFTKNDWTGAMVIPNDSVTVKCVFKDCKATRLPGNQPSLEAYNCYFGEIVRGHLYNCVFSIGGNGHEDQIQYSHVYNSVVFVTGHVYLLNQNNVSFSNTLMVADNSEWGWEGRKLFESSYFHWNCPSFNVKFIYVDNYMNMFKKSSFDNDYLNKCDFILSDLYDNSVYGMYGGPSPYTPFLNVPTITRMSVDAESDEKGLLGVDIEVSGVK